MTTNLRSILRRYVVPGLVVQAVLVGGGYATGRELVEFFLLTNPATGIAGFVLTAALFSAGAMIAFELARRYQAFDYRRFCRIYLGRWWWLFEAGYAVSLVLVLSVVTAAAGKLLGDAFATPVGMNALLFIALIAALVMFGNALIERVIAWWSLLFYATYGLLLCFVVAAFGDRIAVSVAAAPVDPASAILNGVSYTGYNIPLLPILIFVARDFGTRSEALVAGAITGPLVLAPGLAFLLALAAFYPDIRGSVLPVQDVLAAIRVPALSVLVQVVIFGALVKTGAGLLHGLNERIAGAVGERDRQLPRWLRPAVAALVMLFAVYLASAVGLVDLIGRGYRLVSAYFLIVFVAPLLTVGLWKLLRGEPA